MKCVFRNVLLACFLCESLGFSQQPVSAPVTKAVPTLPSTVPAGRPVVGIALEGGGALGLAHVGVLQWFEEHHVPVDRVAGTSMGALIGGLFAAGRSMDDVRVIAKADTFNDLFALRQAYSRLGYRRREDRAEMPQAITLGLRGGRISLGNALVSDERLNTFITDQLIPYNSEQLNFDELPIPFRCVATDLTILAPKVFASGSLPYALRTSIAIPGVFAPIRANGHVFVDGAIVDNLPVDVLRDDLGAQVLIAVHLEDAAFAADDATSLFGVFGRAYQAGTSRNEQLSIRQATIVIRPAVAKFSSTAYGKADDLILAGYKAAEQQSDKLLAYALSEYDWQLYLADRASRKRNPPQFIRSVSVKGEPSKIVAVEARAKKELENKPFDSTRTDDLITTLRSNGGSTAYYETLSESTGGNPSQKTPPADDAITVRLSSHWDGPPYLLLGVDVVAESNNVTSSLFDFRYIHQNLGGYGSELRSTVRVGYLTRIDTEYYRPLTASGIFIQPRLLLNRQPVYLWSDQKRISERLLQRAGGGLDLGWTINPRTQVALTYSANVARWKLVSGSDFSFPNSVSGTAQRGGISFHFSDATSAVASPSAMHISGFIGTQFHTVRSATTPVANFQFRRTWTPVERNTISFSGEANTYFRGNVADPFRFTLGGPLQLYASSIDEYRGTDTVLGRLVFLRKVAILPTGVGEGIYFTAGYEAGNIWSPIARSILRQDAFTGVLLNTPAGALTFGGAVGDAGRRKIFFTFGHLF